MDHVVQYCAYVKVDDSSGYGKEIGGEPYAIRVDKNEDNLQISS